MSDNINHPRHYTQGGVECIDALAAATTGLCGIEAVCTANAIKYLWRWKNKNGVEDLDKAVPKGGNSKMNKQHYPWWGYVKSIVRDYAAQCMEDLTGVAVTNYDAVLEAVNATERMTDGQNRLKLIQMLHWDRTHTIEGAAISIPCSRRTAAYWQKDFFEMVARNRGLMD